MTRGRIFYTILAMFRHRKAIGPLGLQIFITLWGSFLFVSCGTLFSGVTDTINIRTNPEGALIFVNNVYMGRTPSSLKLKLSEKYQIRLSKENYVEPHFNLERKLNKVSLFNTILLPAWVIDAMTGGIWRLKNKTLDINLTQKDQEEQDNT